MKANTCYLYIFRKSMLVVLCVVSSCSNYQAFFWIFENRINDYFLQTSFLRPKRRIKKFVYILLTLLLLSQYDGRVVKALDLSSNGRMSAWVRTPLVLIIFLFSRKFAPIFSLGPGLYLNVEITCLQPIEMMFFYCEFHIATLVRRVVINIAGTCYPSPLL